MTEELQESQQLSETERFQEIERTNAELSENALFLQERLAELELYLEDQTWTRLYAEGEREFSRQGLRRIRKMSRFAYLKSPLINHAVRIQANYVWGQGINIQANDEDVNEVVQGFLDDPRNKHVLTGHQASRMSEIELQVEGDEFIGMAANPYNGNVQVTKYIPDEIIDVITNPDNQNEPWFYKRQWTTRAFNPSTGQVEVGENQIVYYPDWRYAYNADHDQIKSIGDDEVNWDVCIKHVKVGGLSDMRFGVPETYNALDWAMAVKANLEDFASITRALSRFAWNLKVKGGKAGVSAAKQKLNTTLSGPGGAYETNPPPNPGSTWIQPADGNYSMDPMKTAGVAPQPEESKRLWLMVSAGTGIPQTMLAGDAEAGSYATAQSLDRPTELQMRERQSLWSDVFQDILGFVVDQSIAAQSGDLKGKQVIDEFTHEITYVLDDESTDRSIDVTFPDILKRDVQQTVGAIVTAATLNGNSSAGTMDDRTLARLLLSALGEEDVSDILDELFPEEDGMTTDIGHATPDLSQIDPTQPGGAAGSKLTPTSPKNVYPAGQAPLPGQATATTPQNFSPNSPKAKESRRHFNEAKANNRRQEVKTLSESLSKGIASGAKQLRDGKITEGKFVKGAQILLTKAYTEAFRRGGSAVSEGFDLNDTFDIKVTQRVLAQVPYLQNWASELSGSKKKEALTEDLVFELSDDGISQRSDMYGNSVQPSFFDGLVEGAKTTTDEPYFQWDGGDCDLCAARDGVIYAESDLPGYPGEGGFGDLCEGGPNCNCDLSVVDDSTVVSESSKKELRKTLRRAFGHLRRNIK